MKDLIVFKYNDQLYLIDPQDRLNTLLMREELVQLPMQQWWDLLVLKDKVCYADTMIKVLAAKILQYDKSDDINSFLFKGKSYWLDKNSRMGLHNLVDYSEGNIDIMLDKDFYTVSVTSFKEFLKALELYAGKCFINTQKHLNNLKNLKTLEDVINYDYTKGYPEKVIFNE